MKTFAALPLVSVLIKLFQSRRFVVALASLIAYFLSLNVPALATKADLIFWLLVVVDALLLGSFTLEDVKGAAPETPNQALMDLITELLNALQTGTTNPAGGEAQKVAIAALERSVPQEVALKLIDRLPGATIASAGPISPNG